MSLNKQRFRQVVCTRCGYVHEGVGELRLHTVEVPGHRSGLNGELRYVCRCCGAGGVWLKGIHYSIEHGRQDRSSLRERVLKGINEDGKL